ncbi:MAG: hypothetical protein NTX65_02230 [Ignavibacteriales bacterium]|nr:hypothetical protein [Ignavibacteriales bacterium]
MKHFYHLVIVLFLLTAVNESIAQKRSFGLGVMLGEPSGISAKLWTSDNNAFDFGLGWSVFNNRNDSGNSFHFHMDYLWHSFNAISSTERFPLYYGIGGRFRGGAGNESTLAVRGVLGIAWLPRDTPIDVFIELAPSLEFTPSTGFALDAAIGARYFF